jgi:hypothetical protein
MRMRTFKRYSLFRARARGRARTAAASSAATLVPLPLLVQENTDIGANLAAGIPYMDRASAVFAINLINHWRMMPRQEFESLCSRL